MGNQPLFDLRGLHSKRYFLWVGTRVSIKSKEEGKYHESIQLVPHLSQSDKSVSVNCRCSEYKEIK